VEKDQPRKPGQQRRCGSETGKDQANLRFCRPRGSKLPALQPEPTRPSHSRQEDHDTAQRASQIGRQPSTHLGRRRRQPTTSEGRIARVRAHTPCRFRSATDRARVRQSVHLLQLPPPLRQNERARKPAASPRTHAGPPSQEPPFRSGAVVSPARGALRPACRSSDLGVCRSRRRATALQVSRA
jgi:hypothetical protein